MNPFKNKLKEFERKNSDNFWLIRSDDIRKEVQQMARYLSSSSIPCFQAEVIKMDLIGIGVDAEKEGVSLSEKLGVTVKDFCDNIIENVNDKTAKYEHVWIIILNALQFYACWLTLQFWFGSHRDDGIPAIDIIIIVIYYLEGKFLSLHLRNKLSLSQSRFIRGLPYISMASLILIVFAAVRALPPNYYVIRGSGLVIWIVVVCLALAATIGTNIYWDYCSRKYAH